MDRAYTKAEARYIPNGDGSTADMSHPTRTGDVVAFSYPPYQFDAATPGTLVALSAFFGQHGYVPDVQDLDNNINMRATFLAGGDGIGRGTRDDVRTIDLAPTIAYILGVPEPQHSQGVVRLDLLEERLVAHARAADRPQRLPRPTRTDDVHDRRHAPSRSAVLRSWRRCSTKRPQPFERGASLLAAGDNVGASPANSSLLRGHAGDRCRECVGPRRNVVRQPRVRLRRRSSPSSTRLGPTSRSSAPTSSTRRPGENPDWVQGTHVFEYNGVEIGVIGIELASTPELVSAGATAGLAVPRRRSRPSRKSRRSSASRASRCRSCVIHEGTAVGTNTVDGTPGVPWDGPIVNIANGIQDTTVDVILAGHTHRVSNLMVGRHPDHRRASTPEPATRSCRWWSKGRDVEWAGGATRIAKNIGVAKRARCAGDRRRCQRADRRAAQPGDRHASRSTSNARLTRLAESAMGNMVADAMRLKYPGVDAAVHQLRWSACRPARHSADSPASSPARSRGVRCSRCCRSATARRSMTLTGAQLQHGVPQRLLGGRAITSINTGRFPQISGLEDHVHCAGASRSSPRCRRRRTASADR